METGVSSMRLSERRRQKLKRMADSLRISKNEMLGLLIDAAKFRAPKLVVNLDIDGDDVAQDEEERVPA